MALQPYTGVIAWNSFEGGTDGTTITAGNSGGASGTALAIQLTGTGTMTFNNASAIHDDLSLRVAAVGGIAMARWDSAVVGSRTRLCGVMYVSWAAWPSGYTSIVESKQTDSGLLSSRIKVSSAGNIRLTNTSDATVFTSTGTLSLNTVYRVEWDINATTGAYSVGWYLGDSTTPVEAVKTGTSTFGSTIAQVNFGRSASPDHTTIYDTIALDILPLGPRAIAGTTGKPSALVSNAGSWTATGGTTLAVVRDGSDATYVATPDNPSAAAIRYKLEPLSITEVVIVKTRGMASNSAQTIERTVSIYDGATLLVQDVFNLTTTAVTRSTATPLTVTAGTELEVLIEDSAV